ncbi:MAG: SLC13 family permease [Nitrospirota bacterium]|nr:SLC13 family permease [Nitrospirota bacterium]
MEIALVLVILLLALVFFATEWLRVDLTAIAVLLVLAVTGLVTPQQAYGGFANPAVVTVVAMYVLGAALTQTGVTHAIGRQIYTIAGDREPLLILAIMLTVGTISSFMNNIGATAILFPAVMGLARQSRIAPSKLLIPLAFGSLLGGVVTLIGTPPNLLVSMAMEARGMPGFKLFDYAPVGVPVLILGVGYFVFVGRHLLPSRTNVETEVGSFIRSYLTELVVQPGSPLIGRTLGESRLGKDFDVAVLGIIRDSPVPEGVPFEGVGERPTTRRLRILSPLPYEVLQSGDHLLVEAGVEKIMDLRRTGGVQIKAELAEDGQPVSTADIGLMEVVISPQSWIVGRTLKEIDFRNRFQVTALGIFRHGEVLHDKLGHIRIHSGDVLLVQGHREALGRLAEERHFLVMDEVALEVPRSDRARYSVAIMALTVILAGTGLLHISVAATLGVFLMVVAGCIGMNDAYRAVEWKSVFLIGGMIPLADAMEKSGTALWLAHLVLDALGGLGPYGMLAGFFIVTAVITQIMSNAAAALLVVPIALEVAASAGVSARPFAMIIAVAASCSFMTPVAHQASVLVYGPGNYRFFDYTRAGAPLVALIFLLTMFLVPQVFPF